MASLAAGPGAPSGYLSGVTPLARPPVPPPATARRLVRRALVVMGVLLATAALGVVVGRVRGVMRGVGGVTGVAGAPAEAGGPARPVAAIPDSLLGVSGALRFRGVTAAEALAVPGFVAAFGERALHEPALHRVAVAGDTVPFALAVQRPFAAKRGEVLNGYRLGLWPAERWMMAPNYFNPDGFVEVYPADTAVALSEHFRLGDFLTHDQRAIWPKYVVVEEKLVDKLELVLADLRARGVAAGRVVVLSGFRAPYYNARGSAEGMARASRHQ